MKNRPELLPEPLVGREIIFDTLSGELEVALMGGDKTVEFMMNFPGDFQIEASYLESWERLAEVLGLQSRDDIMGYSNSGGLHYAAIQVKNEVDIASLNVDSAALVHRPFGRDLLSECLVSRRIGSGGDLPF